MGAAIPDRRVDRDQPPDGTERRARRRLLASWLTLILVSWLLFSAVLYLGFSAVDQISALIARVTAPDSAPKLEDIEPAAGEATPER
jgi:predicted PurR-regulated permease PerM